MLPLVQQVSTPEDTMTSHDWRNRLATDLLRDATYRQESIIRFVGQVCRDLESRCENVEAPLQAEREQCHLLQGELELTCSRIAELQIEVDNRDQHINDLGQTNQQLEKQVEAAESKANSLLEQLHELEDSRRQDRQELEHNHNDAVEEARKKEIEFLADLTVKDEKIDDQDEELDRLKRVIEGLHEELEELHQGIDTAEQQKLDAEKKVEALEQELDGTTADLELQKTGNDRNENQIEMLLKEQDTLRSEMSTLSAKVSLVLGH
jgi:chromosome segregation ATPase